MKRKGIKLILTITLLVASTVFSFAKADVAHATIVTACKAGESCSISLGGVITLTAIAKDEDGVPIIETPVQYEWSIPTDMGGFIVNTSVNTCSNINEDSCSGLIDGSTSFSEINSGHGSVVQFKSMVSSSFDISVKMTYPVTGPEPLSRTLLFNMVSSCTEDPILYYGIGEVADHDSNNWQKSTAEIMKTCRVEYKLLSPNAQRINK